MAVHFFKALSDDTRLQTCLLIAEQEELCVCELVCALALSQPKISRHLALLKEAGVLATRRDRQWVYYRIDDTQPQWRQQVITTTLNNQAELIEDALARLQAMDNRPSCCD
ncbi:arsenical resistance operon repressor [Pseudoalteromonas sp. SW0106-04]|uniref:metalloregulator ArsR/SmtB family transcription factor n=1 Tax=Pseudoalteromonas sp. SW0106-04 TaxID=1702169 RepID=UPI0006B3FB87|nr:metalloregulator ArsR/SmtB family transcription factor [Pseudoalteromonas sp. SW0106-04]GAP75045.1 arsenical resistance operon repressor [Pseudoalteromonas sp. SW0106-04]